MKRISLIFVLALLPLLCFGQGKVYTKSKRLSDFSSHTTKVVLSGNQTLDAALREAVYSRWRLSPYEFCTEYDESDASSYYLRCEAGSSRSGFDTGVAYLALSKGGDRKNRESLDAGFDVISIPFVPERSSAGREYLYTPALIGVLQMYVEDAIGGKTIGGLKGRNPGLFGRNSRPVRISYDDVASGVNQSVMLKYKDAFSIESSASVDEAFADGGEDYLVGFVVAPVNPQFGGVSYQMVLDPYTHELFYFSSHPYVNEGQRGFNTADIKALGRLARRN